MNKKIWLAIALVVIAVVSFNVLNEGKIENEQQPEMIQNEKLEAFVTQEVAGYNLTFEYPSRGYVETNQVQQSGLFLRVVEDNEDGSTDRFGLRGIKYSVGFSNDTYYRNDSTVPTWLEYCLSNVPEPEAITLDGVIAYRGVTDPVEGSGVGGGATSICLEVDGKGLNIIGVDYSEENILESIISSMRFTD